MRPIESALGSVCERVEIMSEDAVNNKTAEALRERIVAAIKTVFDPEIPVSIYDLGLIYDLNVSESGDVSIRMTLTTPACPIAGLLPAQVEAKGFLKAEFDGIDGCGFSAFRTGRDRLARSSGDIVFS